MKSSTSNIEELINKARCYSAQNDCANAILCLSQAKKEIEADDINAEYYYDNVLWPLSNLYHSTKEYDEAFKIESVEYELLLSMYNLDDNFTKLSDDSAKRFVKFCLSHGVTCSILNKPTDAKKIFSSGYWISFHHFGEFDIETLKLAYNIAGVELTHGDKEEGIRIMEFCYYDMREHLDAENDFVKHVEAVLKSVIDVEPNQLYEKLLEGQKAAKVLLDSFLGSNQYKI